MSQYQPVRDTGFSVVHKPQSPSADVIFIHGLNGHRSRTWTNSSREFWLPWLGKHLPDARVSTYGYNANIIFSSRDPLDLRASEFLEDLLRCRLDNGVAEKPIVFVAHGLGGILVKQAMILASSTGSTWHGIFRNTAGIVFLGTPHRGSSSANEAAACFHLIPFVHTPPLIRLLCKDSPLLVQIAEQFGDIWGPRRIFSFCETEPTVGLKMVVPRKEAITYLRGEQIYDIQDCSHTEITKPESVESDLFTKFLFAIMSLLRYNSSTS
jgi:predicted alpha/beta hydrolase family esterase